MRVKSFYGMLVLSMLFFWVTSLAAQQFPPSLPLDSTASHDGITLDYPALWTQDTNTGIRLNVDDGQTSATYLVGQQILDHYQLPEFGYDGAGFFDFLDFIGPNTSYAFNEQTNFQIPPNYAAIQFAFDDTESENMGYLVFFNAGPDVTLIEILTTNPELGDMVLDTIYAVGGTVRREAVAEEASAEEVTAEPTQEDTTEETEQLSETFTTRRGVSVDLPPEWIVVEDNGISLANIGTSYGISIRVGEDILSVYPDADLTSDLETIAGVVRADLESAGATFGDPVAIEIQTVGIQQSFDMLETMTGSSIMLFNMSDGTPVLIEVLSLGGAELSTDEMQVIYDIAETVRFDAADAVQDTAALAASMAPAEPLRPSEMPEGFAVLSTGASFAIPSEDYQFPSDDQVYTNTTLTTTDFLNTIIVTDLEEEYANLTQLNQFLQFTMPVLIGMGSGEEVDFETFDMSDYFEAIEREDGREVYKWEGSEAGIATYIVELRPGNYGWVQAQSFTADDPAAFLADVETVAMSFGFNPSVTPPTADEEVESSASDWACFNTVFDLPESEEGASEIVTCPAGCTAENIWGTDIYTADSSVCAAAIHAGVITADGGDVMVNVLPGQDLYLGSERNGITSQDWEVYDPSFEVVAP